MFKEDHRPSPGTTGPPQTHSGAAAQRPPPSCAAAGAYAEESDFQDDVLVYNLVALRDARDTRHVGARRQPAS